MTVSTTIILDRNTDYTYNGEIDPNFDIINLSDWDKWCAKNSKYNRTENGYKNKYYFDKEDYNFGICAFPINNAIVQLAYYEGSSSSSNPEGNHNPQLEPSLLFITTH